MNMFIFYLLLVWNTHALNALFTAPHFTGSSLTFFAIIVILILTLCFVKRCYTKRRADSLMRVAEVGVQLDCGKTTLAIKKLWVTL